MNLPQLCIQRPVMTTLLMAAFMVFGITSYQRLPISALPKVDFPTITVTASLPGASAETMANTVAAPLERQFTGIAGIDSMTSTSVRGQTTVTITFNLDRKIRERVGIAELVVGAGKICRSGIAERLCRMVGRPKGVGGLTVIAEIDRRKAR